MIKPNTSFAAPWGLSLKLVSAFSVIILVGLPIFGLLNYSHNHNTWLLGIVLLPLIILVSAVFFMIRGYELSNNYLIVRRLGWETKVELNGLQDVEINPDAMRRSLRTFGNGGLFSIIGKFRNKLLGSYRAFATDPKLAVILRFSDRVIVVTPDSPSRFAELIKGIK